MITTKYRIEWQFFKTLKSDCSSEARCEFELAIKALVDQYNTTIYENRFIVGGAVEVFVCALLRSAGIDCIPYGAQSKGGDILLPNDKKLSVKATLTGITNIKLINQMGTGHRIWNKPTLFVVSGVGIVFGAPDMIDAKYIKETGDGVELTKAGLKSLIDVDSNVFDVEVAQKRPTEKAGNSRRASEIVAEQIMEANQLHVLRGALDRTSSTTFR